MIGDSGNKGLYFKKDDQWYAVQVCDATRMPWKTTAGKIKIKLK